MPEFMYSWEFAGRGRGGAPLPSGADEPLLDENGQPLLEELPGNPVYPEQ